MYNLKFIATSVAFPKIGRFCRSRIWVCHVVVVCVSVTKPLVFGALVGVRAPCPILLYSVQDRSMVPTNDLDRRSERRTTIG